MPVIVGSPRSGTTLLRLMLDAHPRMAIPPDTGFIAIASRDAGSSADSRRRFFDSVIGFPPDAPGWVDFGIPPEKFRAALAAIDPFSVSEGCRAFYRLYAARFGKDRWGDKTPLYCLHMPEVEAVLPEAHFIHLIRDGRDVAVSLRRVWFSPGGTAEVQAEHWRRCVSTARASGRRCRRYLEVQYENLVRHSQRELERICAFIDLPFADEMLAYHARASERLAEHRDRHRPDGSLLVSHADRLRQQALVMEPPAPARIGTWKRDMNPADQQRFEAVAGELLTELGYETGGAAGSFPIPRRTSLR